MGYCFTTQPTGFSGERVGIHFWMYFWSVDGSAVLNDEQLKACVWLCISMPQENVSSLLHGCILCRFSCPQSTVGSYYKIEKVPEINHNLANSWQNNCILISYCDWLQMKLYHGYIWIGKKNFKTLGNMHDLMIFHSIFLYPCVGLSSTVVPGCCRSLGIKENTASWVSRN